MMNSDLLATKVRVPPQLRRAVRREQLTATLELGIPHYKLILATAPAGYGKTTLLEQWANSSRHRATWLAMSQEDNDAERFLRYLFVAWEAVQSELRDSELSLLLGSLSPDTGAVLTAFINAASATSEHLVFVLDDYHLVEEQAIHEALIFLIDHLPPTLHFVLAGRGEPPLPLARYRAMDAMVELRAEDFQFSRQEAADFLTRTMGLALSSDKTTALHEQVEGWVAGLLLTALTLQRRLTEADKLVVSGKHRFIADYLNEDVLAPLEPHKRRFLLQTSILDRLSAPLCAAVTGSDDSQAVLEMLERDGLFLVALDDSRQWYRYHRLFADFLYEQLRRHLPGDVLDLHRRAARWYLAHDLADQAFQHALAGDDVDLVIKIA
jgi:LuxR family maltose regulon positive regulatory protein